MREEREEREREVVVRMEQDSTRIPEHVGAVGASQRQESSSSSSSSSSNNESEQGGSVLLLSTIARYVSLTSFRSKMTLGVCMFVTIIGVLCTIQLRPSTGIPQLFPSEHNIQVRKIYTYCCCCCCLLFSSLFLFFLLLFFFFSFFFFFRSFFFFYFLSLIFFFFSPLPPIYIIILALFTKCAKIWWKWSKM